MKLALTLTFAFSSALLAQPGLVSGRPPLRLSMRQAVEIALAPEGNARVQLAEEIVRQAETRSSQARAALLPNLDSYVSAQNQTRNLRAMGIQFNVPLPGFQFPSLVGPFTTFDVRASATQSVLDLSAIRRFQAARTGIRAAQRESEGTGEQITAAVAKSYLAAVASEARLEAAEANAKLADAMLELANSQKAAGTGTGIEVTRAKVQLADQRQRVLVARNSRNQTRLQLLKTMGLALDTEVELTDKLVYAPVDPVTEEAAVAAALKNRPDLKAQETREDAARLTHSATKLERVPSLAAFADYGSIGTGVNNAIPTRTYGVSVRVPVFDGGRRDARRAESNSQLRQERIRTADLKDQIALEVRIALDNLHSAEEQYGVAEEGVALAEAEMAQAQRRYKAGVASSIEMTDAQTRLERALENRIAALSSFHAARIDLGQATGSVQSMIQ